MVISAGCRVAGVIAQKALPLYFLPLEYAARFNAKPSGRELKR